MTTGKERMAAMFERLHEAQQLGKGISLDAAEVWLLYETCGDALAEAETDIVKFQEMEAEFHMIRRSCSKAQ